MQGRYNTTSVKLLVTALDDLHMIRFKQGWFTLIKYEHQVGELKNDKPRQELLEFVKKVREEGEGGEYQGLKKPETWISQLDLRIDNRFKKEAESATAGKSYALGAGPYGEITPLKDGVGAQMPKSQSKIALKRQRAAAAKKTAASGGSVHAVAQISFKKNFKLKLGGDAIDKDDDVPQHVASDSKVQPIQAESDDKVQLRKPAAATQEPVPAQQPKTEEKPKPVRARPQLTLGAKKLEAGGGTVQRMVQPPMISQETVVKQTPSQPKAPDVAGTKTRVEVAKNEASSAPANPGGLNMKLEQPPKESKLEEIIVRMQKRRGFRLCKAFLAEGRRNEFLARINNFHLKHRQLRPIKKAFERMKINSLSKEVQAYTQDKFQYYLKYVRKLCNIVNKSILTNSQLDVIKRDSFYHWKAQTQYLEGLKEKAELLYDPPGPGEDPTLTEQAHTHLINSVYLHKDSIHWLQNDNVVYLKELRMQTTNAMDGHNFSWQYASARSQTGNPLAENKARFYAQLLSAFEQAHKQHLIVGFDRIWAESQGGDASCASTDNSLTRLQRIRGHMAYLRKVKSSVEERYSTAKLAKPLTLATGSLGGNSVYGGSVGPSHGGQVVAPSRTSGSGNDRRAMIQIETPAQAPAGGGAIALHVDPQLSVDSKQSINVFDGSVLQPGTIHGGSIGPIPATQKQQSYANQARMPFGAWESSLNATVTEDGSVGGAEGITFQEAGKTSSLEVVGQNQRARKSQPNPGPDRDAIFLHHIERQLSENIGLMRLYRGMKLASLKHPDRNRPQYEEDISQDEVDRAVEANRQKVWSVQKIAKIRLQVETIRCPNGFEVEDVKALAIAFSKWESRTKQGRLVTSKQTLFLQRSQKYKSAIQTLNQHFNPTTRVIEQAFDRWKDVLLHYEILKSDTRIQGYGQALARLMPSTERPEAPRPGDQHQNDDVAGTSMAFRDQRLYQKLHSFMLIKQLLLTQYVQRGTVLQKYICMLKYLAQEQSRLQGGSGSRSHQSPALSQRTRKRAADGTQTGQSASAAALQRKHQQEAALIEENVAKLMRCIFRVVFNKWVMFTYHEVKEVSRAREEGMSRIFMALERLVCRRKLTAVSQMHLYSLFIKNLTQNDEEALESPQADSLSMMRQGVTSISLDQKLKRSRLSLQLCENVLVRLRHRALQTKFATWKSNCAIIEWRLNQGLLEGNNQNEGAVEGLENLLKGPGMEDSQGLQKVLEELREGNPSSQRKSTVAAVDEKERIRQMILDFKNARDSEGVKQFFENYYTPKSAAIQQKLQKPWEIKLQREAMKQISQYRGATRAETMLSKASMPTLRDPTLAPLVNVSFDRLRLCQAFGKWARLLREPVGRPEQRAFLRILAKIRKKRVAKRFLYWKHSGAAEGGYPLQCELIEQKTMETLSLVGKHLHSQVARTKEQYKQQVRIRLVNRVMAFLRHSNPVAEAFHVWKQETLQIVAQKYAIRQSIADKEELRQQFELLNSQNQKTVEEHIKQIRLSCVKKNGLPCEECQSVQARKVEALAEIKTNQKNYQELDHLVGQRGMRRLLGSSHHQVEVPAQHSPSSSAFGSSDNRSVLRFAGDRQLDRAGGRVRGHPTVRQHSPDRSTNKSHADDSRADALAQMIEQENQKLRDKNEKVKEQLLTKQQYIESERQKHQEKIKKLKELRDQLMQSYQAAVLGL